MLPTEHRALYLYSSIYNLLSSGLFFQFLSCSISPNETKLPIGINLKAHIFKNRIIAGRIGKCKILHFNHSHKVFPLCHFKHKNKSCKKVSSHSSPYHNPISPILYDKFAKGRIIRWVNDI